MTPDQKIARIKKALESGGGTHTWPDVTAGLTDGRYQFFENDHGVCITEIVQAPQFAYLNCWIVAGELPGVMELQDEVERHAMNNGCRFMQTTARRGWQAVLPKYGWENKMSLFVKECGHG